MESAYFLKMLTVFFPITGMFLDPLLIFFTGLFGGFVSGFLGLGCGVIITPMLMEFGIPPLIAVATQLCHAVGTNLTSFLTYKRRMDVDFHLAAYMLMGGMLGAGFEWLLLSYSPDAKAIFNKFVYVYIIILLIFGIIMLVQSFKGWKRSDSAKHLKSVSMRRWMIYLPFHKIFVRSRTEMSILIPIFVGFLAGILVSSLGGGNNLFMAPIITYLIGRISPVVNGTTALVGCVITAVIALVYSQSNYCCDMFFVLLLFAGAAFGSWIGVKLTYRLPRYYLYAMGSLVVFLMASRQIFKLVHHSFSEVMNGRIEISGSILGKLIKGNPILYTIICITLIAIIAFTYERFLQSFSERGKEGK